MGTGGQRQEAGRAKEETMEEHRKMGSATKGCPRTVSPQERKTVETVKEEVEKEGYSMQKEG